MNCPSCGTWNPDDKQVCWRCQTELPKPIEKKKSAPKLFLGLPVWAWVLIVMMMLFWIGAQVLVPALFVK